MGLTVEEIKADEHFEYKGNLLVTGSIGENATVIVMDGDLTVVGSVGGHSEIQLKATPVGGCIMSSASMEVRGSVGNYVKIKSEAASITVAGSIGNNCNFNNKSGDIKVGDVGNNSTLKSMSGGIRADDVGADCTLKTMSGDVTAANVLKNSRLETMSGDVRASQAPSSVSLKTMSGDIYENGIRRRTQPRHQGGTISIGGLSMFGGSFERVTVGGQDITRLIRQDQSSGPAPQQDEAPVRHNKRQY